jgi:pseudouridine synthase
VTTERDEEGRETVFDALPPDMPRVMSVGRLDLTSEGLLLLTNDGEAKRRLELPSTGWLRRYRVRINGALSEDSLDELRRGHHRGRASTTSPWRWSSTASRAPTRGSPWACARARTARSGGSWSTWASR